MTSLRIQGQPPRDNVISVCEAAAIDIVGAKALGRLTGSSIQFEVAEPVSKAAGVGWLAWGPIAFALRKLACRQTGVPPP